MTEDEIVGWHHRYDGREFEQALGVGDATKHRQYMGPTKFEVLLYGLLVVITTTREKRKNDEKISQHNAIGTASCGYIL